MFVVQPASRLVSDNRHLVAQFLTPVGLATPANAAPTLVVSSWRHTTYRSSCASVKDLTSVTKLTLESARRHLDVAWPTPADMRYALRFVPATARLRCWLA